MTIITFPRTQRPEEQKPASPPTVISETSAGGSFRSPRGRSSTEAGWLRLGRLVLAVTGQARIDGSFRSPRGLSGTAAGWFRLRRLVLGPEGVCASGVFTAELLDADGSTVGVSSRRMTVPAHMTRDAGGVHLTLAAVNVNLLGLSVDVQPFVLHTHNGVPAGLTRHRAAPKPRSATQ